LKDKPSTENSRGQTHPQKRAHPSFTEKSFHKKFCDVSESAHFKRADGEEKKGKRGAQINIHIFV